MLFWQNGHSFRKEFSRSILSTFLVRWFVLADDVFYQLTIEQLPNPGETTTVKLPSVSLIVYFSSLARLFFS